MFSREDIPSIEFFKLHGCGNDFVFIDNRSLFIPKEKMSSWAEVICRRKRGVGADGIAFFELSTIAGADYMWHFFNSDGSRAEMCGNASRCMGVLAVKIGLANMQHTLSTDAGLISITVGDELQDATVTMTDPTNILLNVSLEVEKETQQVHFVNTGVPHLVVFHDNLIDYDIIPKGKLLRGHSHFSPEGVNVNFVKIESPNFMFVRTYERGVEDETLACGTGVCASVIIANQLGLVGTNVKVMTASKEIIELNLNNGKVLMKGPVVHVYTGQLQLSELGLF
ncbi:diaminopimelate epimerase [Lawsonia intracellularis]|uniref:diaminopimelate epimerase n=1 Tax=Lawsonia intracellularis TaxID=29546 RepID=UPI0009781A08|nr:diaminopimelate epimerase [Lawsonia intracellularis]OMQ02791.1 diaminopimelate epimerase [Lawsonia intracellularis]